MKASALRASLLSEAVSGRLVPQFAEEGTAADLLKKIEAEKKALIAAGKLKKEKPLPEITEDEIPFEIPESWAWVRLGELGMFYGGHTPSMANSKFWGGEIPWITSKDMKQKYISSSQLLLTKEGAEKLILFPKGTLLMVVRSGILRRTFPISILKEEATINQDLKAFQLYRPDISEQIYYFLKGLEPIILQDYIKSITTVESVKFDEFCMMPFPLPPLAEQRRIVAKLEELMPLVDAYEKEEQQLTALETAFPENMRKSILQEAVSGKLVPQIAEEGTAAELLKGIEAEKKALISTGKLKKEKPLPEITEDEIPFEIPESWEWVRLGDISNFGKNVSVESEMIDDGAWILELEDIEKDTGVILNRKIKSERQPTSTKHLFKSGNVLYSKLRPYLNKVVVADNDGYCTSEIHVLDFGKNIYPKYAKLCLQSPDFLTYVNNCSQGMRMPRLGTDDGRRAVIPLPPLAEQRRIAAKVEELMKLVDTL